MTAFTFLLLLWVEGSRQNGGPAAISREFKTEAGCERVGSEVQRRWGGKGYVQYLCIPVGKDE